MILWTHDGNIVPLMKDKHYIKSKTKGDVFVNENMKETVFLFLRYLTCEKNAKEM